MSDTPRRVSVVVCTIDRPLALERCLNGLRECTPPPDQVVVVDQGSRPAPPELYDGVVYVHMTERGVSRGRNRGALEAAHDVLAFADDDCVPAPDWIAAITRGYDEGVDGVTGRVLPLAREGGGVAVSSRTSIARRRFEGAGQTPWDIGTGGNLSLHRRAFDAVGGFDERFGPGTPGRAAEDVDLLYRVVGSGFAILYEPEAVVYHETKTRRARIAGRFDYGFGLGAVLTRHAVEGDDDARALRRRYTGVLARQAASGLRHANGWPVLEGALTLAGMLAGSRRRPPA